MATLTQPRCYTVAQLCETLNLTERTFYRLLKAGKLPFLEELRPRLGKHRRYRADLVDQYLSGQWQQLRALRRA